MKKKQKHNLLFFLIISFFFYIKLIGQESNNNILLNPKFESLLKEKRKLNPSLFLNESYNIQIFYGNSEDCKHKLDAFKKEFSYLDGTIIYNSPNYKVWIGNFKTRIEVEHHLVDIKKKYPNALLIKPSN